LLGTGEVLEDASGAGAVRAAAPASGQQKNAEHSYDAKCTKDKEMTPFDKIHHAPLNPAYLITTSHPVVMEMKKFSPPGGPSSS
jgi:hypothetical protein